jgi:hypothetical protein
MNCLTSLLIGTGFVIWNWFILISDQYFLVNKLSLNTRSLIFNLCNCFSLIFNNMPRRNNKNSFPECKPCEQQGPIGYLFRSIFNFPQPVIDPAQNLVIPSVDHCSVDQAKADKKKA